MATIYCVSCFEEMPEDTLPDHPATKIRCPKCKGEQFTTRAPGLTYNDKRFLKSIRVKAEK